MKASDISELLLRGAGWVDLGRTSDGFLHGAPETVVSGVAVAWSPTNKALLSAAKSGANMFITHEPAFYEGFQRRGYQVSGLVEDKKRILDENGMVLYRCHDAWDRMPVHGILDSWASFLEFDGEPRRIESFYKVCLVGGVSIGRLARMIKRKVARLGQDRVLVLGDMGGKVERLVVGTGAITNLPEMSALGADAILATDDGMNFWDGGLWSLDIGTPVIIVNHCTAEKPGMFSMAKYISGELPSLSVGYFDVDLPYRTV